jgi:tetratricopeptide (TPR) repeat protein
MTTPPAPNPAPPHGAQPSPAALQAIFNQGLALHQQGRMGEAEACYREVLATQPAHFDSLHLLGVVALQAGQYARAVEWIEAAVAVDSRQAAAHNNLGNALDSLNRPEEAIESFDKAIALQPNDAEAHNNRGAAFRRLGQAQAAIESYDQAIALKPDHAQAWYNRGNALRSMGRLQAALDSYQAAIRFKADYAEAYNNCGNALRDLTQLQAGLAAFDKAIALKPGYADAHNNRGTVLKALNQPQQAVESYDRALAIRPAYAEAFYNRGNAQAMLKLHAAALESYDKAIALKADYATAWCNRGITLGDLRRDADALASYDQAISFNAAYGDAWNNRGNTLANLRQHRESIRSYDQAIELQPADASAHLNRALCLLQTADFQAGWAAHEWRWKNEAQQPFARNFAQPLWLGAESLQGKTILLHAEQGLGDTLQFCRYARLINAIGARVIVEVQPALVGLLQGLDGAAQVIANGQPLPDFDCHCPLLSLPLALGTNLENLPSGQAYLRAPAHKLVQWQQRLGPKTRLRVGLVWSGNAAHKNDHNRSLVLSELMAHLPQPVDYISLQKEFRPADRQTLEQHPQILRLDQDIQDFTDTAALCELVDVVISVDTSVAHLAGALGRPVWMALPFNPDWRWMLERDDSPWYDSVTLYRQQTAGQWGPVLERMAADLGRLAASWSAA